MSSNKLVAGMLNAYKQQWAANSIGITPLQYTIGMEGSPQKLGVSRLPLTGNSHFLYRPGALNYGRVGRKFQRISKGTVSRGLVVSIYTSTNMIFSH